MSKSQYIYIRGHTSYPLHIIKQGVTSNIPERNSTYITGEYDRGEFTDVWEINCSNSRLHFIDRILKRELKHYNRFNNSGTEFYSDEIIEIIPRILTEFNIKFKKLSEDEISELVRPVRENENNSNELLTKYWNILKLLKLKRSTKSSIYNWLERKYQTEIIECGKNMLDLIDKFYLELATGGGKSYIVYKLLNMLKSETIIIFSPRQKINEQNQEDKYLSLLDRDYRVFNYSKDSNIDEWISKHTKDKKIIIACTQSQDKIYETIKRNNLNDIAIWFDEAHWSVEDWATEPEEDCSKNFFLRDTEKIKKRIFTSASPDKDKIKNHPDVFGELYCPISVKELIEHKWLCPINTRILEYDRDSLNLSDWILNEFEEFNSKNGFSFHSRDNNAFALFYSHYQKYKKYKDNITTIKPYLLINTAGLSDEYKRILETIDLEYDFRDDKDFELKEQSLGYVCKKYDMGYDFKKLDFLVFSDPKMSRQDIIQCIGRGTRPDGLGKGGRNLNKVLNVMLPIYMRGDDAADYKNILEVLRYLVLDLDVDILDDFIGKGNGVSCSDKNSKGADYTGDSNKSVLLDLIYQKNILQRPTTKILYKFCKKYNIRTEEDFNKFKRENPSIPLKPNIYDYNGFKWQNVYDPDGTIYYKTKEEVGNAESSIIKKIRDLDKEDFEEEFYADRDECGWIVLHKHDSKIPPMNVGELDKYY